MMGPLLFLLEFSAFALTEVDHERSNYPRSRGKAVPNLGIPVMADRHSI
jgi:hypothetical protein